MIDYTVGVSRCKSCRQFAITFTESSDEHPLVFTEPPVVPYLRRDCRDLAAVDRSRRDAEELTKTPSQTEGPFYPNKLPLDTDNDLLIINDGITPGVGEVTHLTGKILDAKGNPLKNAVVEIWQCDGNGVYPAYRRQ